MPILNETYYDTIKNKGSIDMTSTMQCYSPGDDSGTSAKNLHNIGISALVGGH